MASIIKSQKKDKKKKNMYLFPVSNKVNKKVTNLVSKNIAVTISTSLSGIWKFKHTICMLYLNSMVILVYKEDSLAAIVSGLTLDTEMVCTCVNQVFTSTVGWAEKPTPASNQSTILTRIILVENNLSGWI